MAPQWPNLKLKIGTEPQSHRYTDTQIDRGRTLWLFIVEDNLIFILNKVDISLIFNEDGLNFQLDEEDLNCS